MSARALGAAALAAMVCSGLIACGGGGRTISTAATSSSRRREDNVAGGTHPAHSADGADSSSGSRAAANHSANPVCKDASYCTAASRAAGTFWPSRRRPQRTSDGSVSYAAPSGQTPPPLSGEMALASPAFALNEPLPQAYTCDGAGISPPIEWKNVPPHAAALVLLAIDLSSDGKSGGIRWIVGDIDPRSSGVAPDALPPGGVVGANAEGRAAYGPVCPATGKESEVQFQLYALSKRIPLSPGFEPAQAEGEYSGLIVGKGAATTDAFYVHP